MSNLLHAGNFGKCPMACSRGPHQQHPTMGQCGPAGPRLHDDIPVPLHGTPQLKADCNLQPLQDAARSEGDGACGV